jgi:F0F1-type ATP synthase delta subunit
MINSRELAQAFVRFSNESENPAKAAEVCLAFLEDNHLSHVLPHIVRHMERMTATDETFNTLQFVTAFTEHAENISKDVVKQLDIKPTDTVISHDPSLIGGFVAEFQGLRYDASIRNQLQQLQATLTRT